MQHWTIIGIYFILVNLGSFIMMGLDKSRARAGAWRIPESRFLLVSAAGGAVGVMLGVRAFRHKTRHLKFTVAVPAILVAQVALAVWLLIR